jgi:hypothetical protein
LTKFEKIFTNWGLFLEKKHKNIIGLKRTTQRYGEAKIGDTIYLLG